MSEPKNVQHAFMCVLLGVFTCAAFAPTLAHAAEPTRSERAERAERATAESLFADGKQLLAAGKIAEACKAFAESQSLDAAGGTLFALAFCHEQENRTASAWLEFKEALALARRDGRHDREVLALEHIAALEPRISQLAVKVPEPAPGLVVLLDGAPLVDAAWGTPIPIDPGAHTLEASAPRRSPWSTTVTIAANGESRIIDVPSLLAETSSLPAGAPATPASHSHSAQRVAGYVTSASGVALLGLGAAFGIRAVVMKNRSDTSCDRTSCDAGGLGDYESARSASRVANIALGAGVLALGVGVALVVTSPHTPESATARALRFAPALGANGAGLRVMGTF